MGVWKSWFRVQGFRVKCVGVRLRIRIRSGGLKFRDKNLGFQKCSEIQSVLGPSLGQRV